MQPAAQMSMEESYERVRISSGARYHLVTTYSVIGFSSAPSSARLPAKRASPKSQSLRSQSRCTQGGGSRQCGPELRRTAQRERVRTLTSRLPGLRSRCQTLAEWMYFRAQKIWYMK